MINWEHYPPAMPEKEEAMKCRNCKAELEKGATVCPSCGKEVNQEQTAKESESTGTKKIKTWQLVIVIVAALALLLSLTVVIYWSIIGVKSFDEGVQSIVNLFTPKENNVFYKDSYSVSDKKAMDKREKVVATVGDQELTNGELQIYYWMNVYDFLNNYGYYAVYAGLDYTQPLDEQQCPEVDGTWQHFFLDDALSGWHNYQAMALMAEKEGMKLDEAMQEDLDTLRETLATTAVDNGFSSIDAMLQSDMGPGCTYDDYYSYMKVYYTGYMYFSDHYNAVEITDEMLENYFTTNEETLKQSGITKDSGNLYDVRHILIEIEGGTKDEDGNMTYTDAEWEACRVKAQGLLDEWLAGEHTEETFAEMANKHSADTGSNTNGGLYTDLDKDTTFVDEFVDWYMAEDRKAGDYGLIKTSYGYHIMYCSDVEAEWIAAARDGIMNEESAKILKAATAQFPMEVTYKNIVLGVVDLSTSS